MGLRHRHSFESVVDQLQEKEQHDFVTNVAGKINMALVFPNLYSLGMSNLGFLTVHRLASEVPGIGVERFFPALVSGVPLKPPYYSFETRRPLGDFDILAFSFSYEGDFDKIPAIFGALGLPVCASDRNHHHPILICGGAAVASNPKAMSRIFDVVIPGEAEITIQPVLQRFLEQGLDPETLCDLPGVWVPAFSDSFSPCSVKHDVNQSPAYAHILAPSNSFGGAQLIEVMRGCPRNCAFCLARVIYSPPRPVDISVIEKWLDSRENCTDLGLVAPSLFDHPQILQILELLHARGIRIRNSSVKWEKLEDKVLDILRSSKIRGLTLAPETGSKKLQLAMKKPLNESMFFETVDKILAKGFDHLKLYFVAGLPGETNEDLDETIDLIRKVSEHLKEKSSSIGLTFSSFVPKQGTTWQDENAFSPSEMKKKYKYLKGGLKKIAGNMKMNFESPQEANRQVYLSKVGPELADEYAREAENWRQNRIFSKNQFVDLDF